MLPDNPLLAAPNCIITPHIAWASLAARKRLMTILAGNISTFLQGASSNLVNHQYLP
jgi:glycerate dehydrogenase